MGKKEPKLVITDGLHAYKEAFKSEFHDSKFSTRYAVGSGFDLNSILERMQGNIRGRERVMRGLRIEGTSSLRDIGFAIILSGLIKL